VVTADLHALARVWTGDVPLAEPLDGPTSLVRAFPTWFRLSSFAGVERVSPRWPPPADPIRAHIADRLQ
jgi:hypothetical protein